MLKGMMLAASGALGGGTPPVSGDIFWSLIDKASGIDITEGGALATTLSSSRLGCGGDYLQEKSSGKWYAEFEIVNRLTSLTIVGFSVRDTNRTSYLGSRTDGYGYLANGQTRFDGVYDTGAGYASYDNGDIVSIAVDLDGGTFEFKMNGVSQGVEPATFDAPDPYTLAMSSQATGASIRLLQPTAFNYPIPAGYSAWTG